MEMSAVNLCYSGFCGSRLSLVAAAEPAVSKGVIMIQRSAERLRPHTKTMSKSINTDRSILVLLLCSTVTFQSTDTVVLLAVNLCGRMLSVKLMCCLRDWSLDIGD